MICSNVKSASQKYLIITYILRARAATCNQRKVNNLELYDKLTVTNGTNFPSRKFNSVGKFCIRFEGKKLDICFRVLFSQHKLIWYSKNIKERKKRRLLFVKCILYISHWAAQYR